MKKGQKLELPHSDFEVRTAEDQTVTPSSVLHLSCRTCDLVRAVMDVEEATEVKLEMVARH